MKRKPSGYFWSAVIALSLAFAAARGVESVPPSDSAKPTDNSAPPAAVEPVAAETPPATNEPAKAEVPPAAVDSPSATPASAAKAEEPAAPVAPAGAAKEGEAAPPKNELRRLDQDTTEAAPPAEPEAQEAPKKKIERRHGRSGNEMVSFGRDAHVAKDETVEEAVTIFGSTTIDGEVRGEAVSIFGKTTVNGSVGGGVVAVMGSVYINGPVGGEVVAVMGNVELGPKADVKGEIVTVGGALRRDPQAVVHGPVQSVSFGKHFPEFGWLYAWVTSALLKGRLLSFAGGTAWAWGVAAIFLGFYALLALFFRGGIEKCAETLEQQPGYTILAALLTMLALPLVIVLLAITGVGVLVIPVLGVALFAAKLFGRAAVLSWYGRRLTGLFGQASHLQAVVTVLIGGVFMMLLYLVPVLAFVILVLNGVLGLGMVIYTLVLGMRRNGTKAVPAVPAMAAMGVSAALPGANPVTGVVDSGVGAAMAPPVHPILPQPPIVSAVTLPRVGFWLRLVASLLDAILIGVAAKLLHGPDNFFLLLFAAYCVILWALKGTTIGGIICGLKVVRLDDRPVDWSVAIVRALAGFLSLVIIGLGFIWTAFDSEKQSWHDKIAGTTIVKVPKGVSLI
ncbi:MAG: hypothetical protein A3G75_08585 [Verrucomicrobia bacterium RIFCSPLOWO2_12_FULL_64_8]|nr:MAG: hypothetical protein A3G75_08585 [Verrucomicrobia bacterium RIFCSPLOWO2_12_FULL_64_8]